MTRWLITINALLLALSSPALATTEDHGDKPSLLAPELGSVVWSIVLFALLLVVLGKFVWPQILKGLQDRESKIKSDLEAAQNANEQAKATLAEYETKLAEARAEARGLIEQARTDADGLRAKLTSQTEEEITRLRQQATEQIRLAKQQAVQELYTQAAGITTDIAAKVLQRQINEDDAKALVEQSLRELENMN